MGTSGQSFGAFAVKGVLLELEGDSQEGFWPRRLGIYYATIPPGKSLGMPLGVYYAIGMGGN